MYEYTHLVYNRRQFSLDVFKIRNIKIMAISKYEIVNMLILHAAISARDKIICIILNR